MKCKHKKPEYEEAEACIAIRKRSKRGENFSEQDHQICAKMLAEYPEWYKFTEARVFNETAPFGSSARR